jgi:hypothetical protein
MRPTGATTSLVVTAAMMVLACATRGCASRSSCTEELRSYPIDVTRVLDIAYAPDLRFEACVSDAGATARCETATASQIALGLRAAGGIMAGGSVVSTSGGKTQLTVLINVNEAPSGSTTAVSLRVTDTTTNASLSVRGDVKWENVVCHPRPLATKL